MFKVHCHTKSMVHIIIDQQIATNSTHFNLVTLNFGAAVILLQIVIVCPGTHLVKNHESQCTEPMSASKKSLKLKMLGCLCNQTVDLNTDSKTVRTIF